MTDTVEIARQKDRGGRKIRVLILVKTTPSPSDQYEETVCVAGIALDPCRWVRLYPVKFRDYDQGQKFKKYDIVEIGVRLSSKDHRPESLHINGEPTIISSVGKNWSDRHTYLAQLPEVTLCQLQRGTHQDTNAQSLGAVCPNGCPSILVEKHLGWTAKEKATIDKWAREDLFGNSRPPLQAPKFKARLHFRCLDTLCSGHTISLIDWEATALQQRFREDTLEYAQRQFQTKFVDQKFKDGMVTQILVGNQAHGTKRRSFIALGLFGPYTEPLPGFQF